MDAWGRNAARKLAVLGYPNASKDVRITDRKAIVAIVTFLEDRVVRFLPPEERGPLRVANDAWEAAFQAYLQKQDYVSFVPGSHRSLAAALSWLIDAGVSCEFQDKAAAANETSAKVAAEPAAARSGAGGDAGAGSGGGAVASQRVAKAAQGIAAALGVELSTAAAGASAADMFQELLGVVRRLVAKAEVAASKQPHTVGTVTQKVYPAGFATGAKSVDTAASILRMLYVADLRELQDQINDNLTKLQALTANPKTDSRLGKVGR